MLRRSCSASGANLELGNCDQNLAAFLLGAQRFIGIAIGLVHLLVMDLADLVLRFGGFLHGRIEQDEILVLGFRLSQAARAAFAIPASAMASLALARYSLDS